MIKLSTTNKCFSNIAVGDRVVVKLLPYDSKLHVFEKAIVFPVIGFHYYRPLIGTNDGFLYKNHHFVSTRYCYGPISNSLYAMLLANENDVQLERVIKYNARFHR